MEVEDGKLKIEDGKLKIVRGSPLILQRLEQSTAKKESAVSQANNLQTVGAPQCISPS